MTPQQAVEEAAQVLLGADAFIHVDPVRELATPPSIGRLFVGTRVYYVGDNGQLASVTVRAEIS